MRYLDPTKFFKHSSTLFLFSITTGTRSKDFNNPNKLSKVLVNSRGEDESILVRTMKMGVCKAIEIDICSLVIGEMEPEFAAIIKQA